MNEELAIILETASKIFNKHINHDLRQFIDKENINLINLWNDIEEQGLSRIIVKERSFPFKSKLLYKSASGGTDWSAQIAVLEEKVSGLENVDTSHTHKVGDHKHEEHSHTVSLINKKEIDLLKIQIEEIKVKASNPLAN